MKSAVNLLTFLCLFSCINIGHCNPRCYICDSQTNPNCIHPKDHKMETHECTPLNLADMKTTVDKLGITRLATYFDVEIDRSDFNVPLTCVKTVSKVHDKEVILRGCQLAPKDNLDVCKKLLQEGKDIVQHCSFCNENGCNSAPFTKLNISLITLVISLMVSL